MRNVLAIFGVVLGLLFVLGGLIYVSWVLPSRFEARTYRKLTGKQVTTWDAMWLELRIQEQAKDRSEP